MDCWTILKQIKVEEMRPLLSAVQRSRSALPARLDGDIGTAPRSCTMADERPDGDGASLPPALRPSSQHLASDANQQRHTADDRSDRHGSRSALRRGHRGCAAVEGYPATDLFDFLGRRTGLQSLRLAPQSSTPTAKQLAARSSPRLRAAIFNQWGCRQSQSSCKNRYQMDGDFCNDSPGDRPHLSSRRRSTRAGHRLVPVGIAIIRRLIPRGHAAGHVARV